MITDYFRKTKTGTASTPLSKATKIVSLLQAKARDINSARASPQEKRLKACKRKIDSVCKKTLATVFTKKPKKAKKQSMQNTGKKRKKQKKKTKNVVVEVKYSKELLDWAENNTVYENVHRHTTMILKGMCMDNGLKYGGPKYKLIPRIIGHAKKVLHFVQCKRKEEKYGAESLGVVAEKKFFAAKSFEDALGIFIDESGMLNEVVTSGYTQKIRYMAGLTAGFDHHLYMAITGPSAGEYNGKHGETGVEGHEEVAELWKDFIITFLKEEKDINLMDWELVCNAMMKPTKTVAYGLPKYGDYIRFQKVIEEEIKVKHNSEALMAAWKKKRS